LILRALAKQLTWPKKATCIDVEHKKRGRPRLRDDRGETRTALLHASPLASALASATPVSGAEISGGPGEGYRVLRSQSTRRDTISGVGSHQEYGGDPRAFQGGEVSPFFPVPIESLWRQERLVAFLNLDLRILKSTEQLRTLLADGGEVKNRLLEEFVDPTHHDTLRRLQNQLREERTQREPTFLPGIFPELQEQQAVQGVSEEDVDRITQGFADRSETWTIRLVHGRSEAFYASVRLARTSSYFAALILRRAAGSSSTTLSHATGYTSRRQSIEMAAPVPSLSAAHGTREMSFIPSGPSSPFAPSAPTSPFSTLPQNLRTTLPPAAVSSLAASHGPGSPSPGEHSRMSVTSGYFQSGPSPTAQSVAGGASMQPPPQPTSIHRSGSTAQERRRPEPLTGVQLPPIVSTSAPTTPLGSHFFEGSPSQPGSAQRRSTDTTEDSESQEANRKRRRLNIGEIIEKYPKD
jgi:hypothetical protein